MNKTKGSVRVFDRKTKYRQREKARQENSTNLRGKSERSNVSKPTARCSMERRLSILRKRSASERRERGRAEKEKKKHERLRVGRRNLEKKEKTEIKNASLSRSSDER